MCSSDLHEFMDRTTQAVTEELSAGRVERAAKLARKYLPGKASDALIKASENFTDAMENYADDVRADSTLGGRLTELPIGLEAPIRKIKDAVQSIVALINADYDIPDVNELAERARVKGALNEVNTTCVRLLKLNDTHVLWFEIGRAHV